MNLTATKIKHHTVSLTRDINAPREKVFQALTDPEILTKWFGPKGVSTESVQVDLRVSGKYQFRMKEPNGNIVNHGGQYREIDPPNKLVFTWILEGQNCEGSEGLYAETVVTIEFHEIGDSTRLILTHEFLPNEKSREGHTMGWIGCFDKLKLIFK